MILKQLQQFRQALYDSLGKARDAVFDLMDAVLVRLNAASLVIEENYPAALEQFLSILTSDRKFRDDDACKAMLSIFDRLGDDHPLTKEYRKRLVMVLY